MRYTEFITEKWSQKYKSSINCGHPKGFSQRAHCASKNKHNESAEMEMVCETCGMCQTHGNVMEIRKGQKDSNGYTRCWPGKHAEGTKTGKNGGQVRNCVPNESMLEDSANKCPPATQDITLNLKNRQKAINEYGYGPLNPDLPNTKFWMKKVDEWNLDSAEEAKSSLCGNCAAFDQRKDTLDCIAQGIDSESPEDAQGTIDAGDLGYCRFLKFKCASRRTCDAWVIGGPLTDKPVMAEDKVKLYTDPGYFGAEVDDTEFDSLAIVDIPANQLVGFEPDDKMNQPKSKANVEKIVAGLKQGAKLPPLLVRKYKNGYQVLDGHHRFWAYKLLGVKSIPSRIVPDEDIEEISKQGVTEEKNIYTVVFVDPSVGPKVIGKFGNLVKAKKLIRDSFYDIYDSGDRLRRVAPNIFVLEPDYQNTGEIATADEYEHFYHWIIQTSQGVLEGYSSTTFQIERRRLNVPALIKAGAVFVTYPHGDQGWETDAKLDWQLSLITLMNVEQIPWCKEAPKYRKPASYKKAEQQINSSAPNLGNDQLVSVSDGKYNQILWSIKKLGIPDNVAFLDQQGIEENFADGKGPGRAGDSQRHGIPKHATMAELEKASHAVGRKGQLAHWQLNMRRGQKK